ncbi:MAG: sigma-54-dependent transcriptional response regulator [Candidatus Rokubacteria bacterium CSP1-6]|nr:MAG: sigma-54-dependent transcriptional response regulator [Candidatus Rokubacteria bacterium CSP1-6]
MTEAPERILVVDDEENMVHFLTKLLRAEGFVVEGTGTGEAALDRLRDAPFELVLTDLKLPDTDGIEILKAARELHPETVVVLITAHGTIESAIEAMRAGAYDYVTKPFRASEILQVVNKALERVRLRREVVQLRQAVEQRFGLAGLVGKSAKMQEVYTQIEKFAAARGVVLIQGESGTGKELVAKALHFNSPRKAGPFVVIDCGAIPEALQESELFGHEKGAFTGAIATKKGLFEEAHGGTLFLDEVAELAPGLQAKLLRALQDGEIRRVGGTKTLRVDARVIAATNRDLAAEVRDGAFREDLFFRLNVFPLFLPPLRERREDIPLFVDHFLDRIAQDGGGPLKRLSPEALRAMLAYPWPGNVRELEHALERAALLSEGEAITARDLPPEILAPGDELTLSLPGSTEGFKETMARVIRDVEVRLIRRALAQSGSNRTEAARILGISRRALLYKLKEYNLGRL